MQRATVTVVVTVVGMAAAVGIGARLLKAAVPTSGVPVGGMLSAYRPRNVTGAKRGTDICPLCAYPKEPAVQVWVNGDDERNVAAIGAALDSRCVADQQEKLKGFVVYENASHADERTMARQVGEVARMIRLKRVAYLYVHSGDLKATEDNEINTDSAVKNTVFVYRNMKVSAKFVNLVADARGLSALNAAISAIVK